MSAPYTPKDERNDNSGRTFTTDPVGAILTDPVAAAAERIAHVLRADLFSPDEKVSHRAAAPYSVASARANTMALAMKAAQAALSTGPQTGKAHSEVLTADEGGCVTKRFVIFTTPGMSAEKKGGWLKDEHLIDFLREVVLHDGWKPGFEATVLELTWNNDLWASNGIAYLRNHDDAIGPRRARKAWKEARAKHERIYRSAPSSKLGKEVAAFLSITKASPIQSIAIGGEAHG